MQVTPKVVESTAVGERRTRSGPDPEISSAKRYADACGTAVFTIAEQDMWIRVEYRRSAANWVEQSHDCNV